MPAASTARGRTQFLCQKDREDTHMFPYIASTLLYRLHRRETQPALLSTAALSRQVESKLLDRAGSGSGHNYTVPGRWSAGARLVDLYKCKAVAFPLRGERDSFFA